MIKEKINTLMQLKEKKLYFGILKIIINNLIPPSIFNLNKFYVMHLSKAPDIRKFKRFFRKYETVIKSFSELNADEKSLFDINNNLLKDIDKMKFIFVVSKEGIIGQSILMIGTDFISRSKYKFSVPEESGWLFDTEINKKYRLSPAYIYLISEVVILLSNKGMSDIYGETNFDNIHSLKSHQRIGFEVDAIVSYISVGGWRHYFIKKETH